ncbi:hypothetical protein K432DRAFT_383651 [Lepidopterella palustris CBS 459.81]|uniref:Uncharacterized protein n=1 Tax=Lepidopterella palustris CBS 459.81 TaxID=1314670 RepID=A0A8E2E7D5_9PEZI|nr:hypothetical protein K432DRAFT_383651 [Lepidopterella palustris CBS 459.81]
MQYFTTPTLWYFILPTILSAVSFAQSDPGQPPLPARLQRQVPRRLLYRNSVDQMRSVRDWWRGSRP